MIFFVVVWRTWMFDDQHDCQASVISNVLLRTSACMRFVFCHNSKSGVDLRFLVWMLKPDVLAVGWRRQYVDSHFGMRCVGVRYAQCAKYRSLRRGTATRMHCSLYEMPSSLSLKTTQVSRKTNGRKHLRFQLGHGGRCTTNRSILPDLSASKSLSFLESRCRISKSYHFPSC